ncbi:hypothetical protein [Escherichia coli]|uniref:hypothetical protein n=1 Tax=Escherichia coli TaxID=562 RepID=UPI0040683E12
MFSYSSKDRIISILKRLKRDPSVPYEGYIISEADYATNVVFFNDVLDKYIDVFSRSKTADIVAAEVDQARLRNTDARLTNELPGALSEDVLLKYFTFTQNSECDRNWLAIYIPVGVSKSMLPESLIRLTTEISLRYQK